MIVVEEHDSENLEEISDSLNKYDEFRPSQVQSTIWSKKYVLLLLTLEQLFIFKIKENGIKFLKHYNEFSHNNFKPGLKNLIECMLKKKLKTNVTEIKILYKSLKNLNY